MNETHERIGASFRAQAFMQTLGARLVRVADGEVHIELPAAAHLTQQHGYVHAGAITSVVDSACGYAALTQAPPGHEVVTVEFKLNFIRPAVGAYFLCVGKVQKSGKTLTVCTGEVRAFTGDDTPDTVIALIQATMAHVAP